MALTRAQAATEVMLHLINHPAHGYSQPNRNGDGSVEELVLSDGEIVYIHGRDYDCSEAVEECWEAVGVLPKDTFMVTWNEIEILRYSKFVEVNLTQVLTGDILWRTGHTEMYLGNDMCGGARLDENYDIFGNIPGDQTEYEISMSEYNPKKWEKAFRYMGPERFDTEFTMYAIINIIDANTSVYYDGVNINDLTDPKDIGPLDKISVANNGKKVPRVSLTKEEFARLCQGIRGDYPKHLASLVEKYKVRSPEK